MDVQSQSSPRILQSIGPDIWIADGSRIKFLGLWIGTRMTVAGLAGGGLWVHSPVALTRELGEAVRGLGDVAALVAPNKLHHLFLKQWIGAFPRARVFGAPGLRGKRGDMHFDEDLGEDAPAAWREDIDQTIFSGSRAFDEVVFFHKASRTLILTDLVINMRLDGQGFFARQFARLEGIVYPDGSAPLMYRLSMKDKLAGRRAAQRMLAWAPEAIVISHGEWFETNGSAELKRRFAWILNA